MPNHVTNLLFVKGDESQVKLLMQAVKNGSEDFDIAKYYPMPDALRNISAPTRILTEEEYADYLRRRESGELSNFENMTEGAPITEYLSQTLIKTYGYNNWYDWAVNNWGTKWGSYDSFYFKDRDCFEFLTAWDPPVKAILKLSQMFPMLNIKLKYSDEDFGNYVGEIDFYGGQVVNSYTPEEGLESYLFAMQVNGRPEYYIDELEEFEEGDKIDTLFIQACLITAHRKRVISDKYPKPILDKLIELAVADEMYERAAELKKIIDQIPAKS